MSPTVKTVTYCLAGSLAIPSIICVHMRHECWTSQGSLSRSPWQSVCHDWTTTYATHNCMPGCESILTVPATWLIYVCGFCLCGIRSWKSHVWWFLGMKELLDLLQRCWVGEAGSISWPGRSCEFTFRDHVFFEIMSQNTFIFDIWHSADGKTHWNWTCFDTWSLLGLYKIIKW
jgi:hypothetical protein